MKFVGHALALTMLGVSLAGPVAFAEDRHDNHHFVKHDEWRKGEKIRTEDWGRGDRIDYRQYHLNAPPRGYEWREVDGNFVMAAVATGVIATVVAESAAGH